MMIEFVLGRIEFSSNVHYDVTLVQDGWVSRSK